MGNGSSFLPTEQDSAQLSDATLAALQSLPEGSQQELAALGEELTTLRKATTQENS